MPRLQLTDEEAQVIADFRRKNEVRDAWCKALDWAHDFIVEHARNYNWTNEQTACEQLVSDMVRAGRDVVLVEPRKKRS